MGRGDRVAAYMPNVPETVVAFLACASIGAVWSSCAPEFGTPTVVDRFKQIEPKVLIATDGYRYGGKDFDRRERVAEIVAAIPSIEHTVMVPSGWEELLAEPAELSFERLPFDHPLWVLYSSGTTGLPKAIVQGQGGILLEHLKKSRLHSDLAPGDRFFWFTTTGWMMWNFLVGGLLAGAAIVLYDGQPDPERLWEFGREAGVTTFGTSAGFIAASMKAGVAPSPWEGLRSVGSTGSPLPVEGFDWVYERFPDVWLFSTSGGTDLCTAFVGGVPAAAGVLGRAAGALPRRGGGVMERGRAPAHRRGGRARDHAADAVDADLLLERRGRRALPLELLRDVPGRVAARRLDQDHRARHGGDLRALGLDDQPRRGPDGNERDLQRRRGRADEVLDSLVVDVDDEMILFVVVRDGLTDEVVGADPPPRARALLAAPRAGPDRGDPGDARARSRTRSSRCR